MATAEDAQVVSDLVTDAARLLDWCAGWEALITRDDGQDVSAVPVQIRDVYAAAVDQLAAEQVALALSTLAGGKADGRAAGGSAVRCSAHSWAP